MNAADLLVACLEAEGVERAFGLPGEELEDLLFALRDSDVTFVPVRHEQGAAFMADVHGRVTGEAGVCISTLGPGATNLLTGVADAHLDKSPLVAITGQAGSERLHKESHQMIDVVEAFDPVVKWNARLSGPEIVSESVRKAFKLAEWEKPGATHLELPEDVASAEAERGPLPQREVVRRAAPDPRSLRRAVDLLSDAADLVVLAGNGAVRTGAAERLRTFVDAVRAPVVATYMGKGAVSDADDNSLMTLDSGPNDEATRTIRQADCVLTVGYDIAEHDPDTWNPDGEATVVHVDHEPAEVYAHYNPEVELVADIAATLRALTDRVDVEFGFRWCEEAREAVVRQVTERPDPDDPLTVEGVLPHLRDAMADEDVLVSDVGRHKMVIARRFPTYEPNTCIVSNGLASMGIAVPGGVAADLALEENVVVATGDGGFLMNAAELETAKRLDCGFTVVVFADAEHSLITEQQLAHRGEEFGTRFGNPDLVAFAESFGVAAHRPETWDALADVLDRAVPADDLRLVEVPLE